MLVGILHLRRRAAESSTYNTAHVHACHGDITDFSNILSKAAIERLADVDEYEVVREVQV